MKGNIAVLMYFGVEKDSITMAMQRYNLASSRDFVTTDTQVRLDRSCLWYGQFSITLLNK